MASTRSTVSAILCAGALAGMAAPTAALAQARHYSARSDEAHGPQKLVDKAASVVVEMERDRKIAPLIGRAVGLYVIPEYGRAGFIIGGKGGAGVVVTRNRTGGWSSPAFFNTGGLSIGAQIGAAGGAIVYLLMDRKAVDAFRSPRKFALDAGAGVSVINYSDAAQGSTFKGDAVLWTNIKGAYAGATVGATGVDYDQGRVKEYYGRPVNVNALLDGRVTAPGARALTRVLPR
ncbi:MULTISPECIES: lipid-binding SYLF domain-containing protein [unclassified Sphingomonas]|uniref:lipid-binding SYLF domain-containing protein n=1 Tax=unclassified Sphingomonas TaxID=196159 RepID=UPI001F59E1D1|nr:MULTISPECIES: lipid-binding SYLF domain-containing protein [unclassified Sphingomonas]